MGDPAIVDATDDAVGFPFSRSLEGCTCPTCTASSPDPDGPRVMRHTEGEPGESLVGLLGRAARRNDLSKLRTLLAACTSTWHVHFNLAARDDLDFDQLAHAARLAPHDVLSRRYRRVELTTDLPGVDYHGARIPAYDLDLRPRRLAPSWLSGDAVHCALGHHALATHCPVSGDLLIDHCPSCSAMLNWSSAAITDCPGCSADLRSFEPRRVSERELEETRPMLDLIHPDPGRHGPAVDGLCPELAGIDRGAIFEIGWRLGSLATGRGGVARDDGWRLPVVDRLEILAAGSDILSSWPGSMPAILRGGATGTGHDPSSAFKVRSIARARNVWPEVRDAIYASVPALSSSVRSGVRQAVDDAGNGAEFTRGLGVSQRVYERMRDAEAFRPVARTGSVNLHDIFDLADAEPFRALLADRVPLPAASERLDVPHHAVEQLCCLRRLTLLDQEFVRAALKQRHVTSSGLEALIAAIEEARPRPFDDPIALVRAMRTVGGREKPWGPVLVALLEGRIAFRLDRERSGRTIARISVSAADVPQLREMSFDEATHGTFQFDDRINRRDVERLLNVDPTTFGRAIAGGELPGAVEGFYDRAEMLDLASRRISCSEILVRWTGWGQKMPRQFKGRNGLRRAGHLGWDRAVVDDAMCGVPAFFG